MNKEVIEKQYVGKRSKAHVYIMTDGSVVKNWPLSERNVWATKREQKDKTTKGLMIHVELNYKGNPSEEQYNTLADLYIEACKIFERTLIIVPHREVDRGLPDGHNDPENFDFDKLYKIISLKGLNTDCVEKIDQVRYERPNQADQLPIWPPELRGKPKRKPVDQPRSI